MPETNSDPDWELDAIPEEFPADVPFPSEATPPERAIALAPPNQFETVDAPSAEELLEAFLFVGGRPLTPIDFEHATRLPEAEFHTARERLNQRYEAKQRPFRIEAQGDGFALVLHSRYAHFAKALLGGPREARLSPPLLETLSVVAYRQPITKAELDALRGVDTGNALRQLTQFGLIAPTRTELATTYRTTSRFLSLFHLQSLNDLPRLGESSPIGPE
ncbi:MAG: SMC-Scp complex subunit ScpB [Gemmataceae bacterium]